MPRIQIGEKVYETTSINDVSLRDLMLFDSQARALGLDRTFHDIESTFNEIGDDDEAFDAHPDKYLLVGVLVWIARRTAGEDVSFADAIDVPLSSIEFLGEPEPAKKPGPTRRKPDAPASAPAASAPDVAS